MDNLQDNNKSIKNNTEKKVKQHVPSMYDELISKNVIVYSSVGAKITGKILKVSQFEIQLVNNYTNFIVQKSNIFYVEVLK